MKLPNGHAAIIDVAKIRDYCLNPAHPLGRHKARVFMSTLRLTAADSEELLGELKTAAKDGNVAVGESDEYGTRFIIDFDCRRNGRFARVRSCWILRTNEIIPRFLTCHVL
jgi:hypothetical protein